MTDVGPRTAADRFIDRIRYLTRDSGGYRHTHRLAKEAIEQYDYEAEAASAVVSEPPTALDVERLMAAASRVGLELFPLQAKAIAREYARLAAYNAPATGESRREDGS